MLDPTGASRASGNAFASLLGGAVGPYHLLHHVSSDELVRHFYARMRRRESIERVVLVNIAKVALGEDPPFEEAFLEDAERAMSLRDPHLVVPFDAGRSKVLYTASEYVEGASLSEITDRLRDRDAVVPPSVVLRIALDVLAGLQVAHAAGVVHGGIEPNAIWVGSDGVARLTDFATHRLTERRLRNLGEPALVQLAYLAPEQANGDPCEAASDVFALAVVLWEALTGRRLFLGKTDSDTRRAILGARIVPPSQRASDVPPALDAILLAALDRDRGARLGVAAMREQLERCGVAPATGPQLSEFVAATCVRWLGHQRGLLRAHAVEPPTAALQAPAPSAIDAIIASRPPPASATPAEARSLPVEAAVEPPRRRRRPSSWPALVALLLCAFAAFAAGIAWRRRSVSQARSAPSDPPATIRTDAATVGPPTRSGPDTAAPIAPAANAHSTASADASTPRDAVANAEPAPTSTAQAAARTRRNVRHRRVRHAPSRSTRRLRRR